MSVASREPTLFVGHFDLRGHFWREGAREVERRVLQQVQEHQEDGQEGGRHLRVQEGGVQSLRREEGRSSRDGQAVVGRHQETQGRS